ncbi:MAG: hypothetical protein RID42_01295 [Alphaproteobacteria bacterium]
MPTTPDFTAMILLSYTPRAGIDTAAYETWLNAVDNPFFNGVPGIARYTNWKITGSGSPVPFTHFDTMGLDSVAAAADVWQRQDVKDFTAEWRRLWGQGPDAADLSVNAHVYLFENDAGAGLARHRNLVMTMADAPVADAPEAERWRLVRPVRGVPRFHYLRLQPGAAPAALPPDTVAATVIAEPA